MCLYLIGDIAVSCYAIRTDDHSGNGPIAHEGGGHGVCNESGGDALVHELVCS